MANERQGRGRRYVGNKGSRPPILVEAVVTEFGPTVGRTRQTHCLASTCGVYDKSLVSGRQRRHAAIPRRWSQ